MRENKANRFRVIVIVTIANHKQSLPVRKGATVGVCESAFDRVNALNNETTNLVGGNVLADWKRNKLILKPL